MDYWIWLSFAVIWWAQFIMSKRIDQQTEYLNAIKEFFDKYLIREE